MKLKKLSLKKSKAQAMVEFAIALPLLMLLLYGLLETGRLLFLYSTVVTASRQAVRYGSATGENASGTPRFGDCDGIRAAAQNFDYLGGTPFTVAIYHDAGPTDPPPGIPYCSGPTDGWSPADNSQRIKVTVSEQFEPIVPGIVPFLSRTITATSARTILVGVSIVVAQPTVEYYQYPTATDIVSFNPEPSQPDVTQDVVIQVTVRNTEEPSLTPTGEVLITGADVNCTITLANGAGSCILHFASSGFYSISAEYTGDDEHIGSTGTAIHEVNLAPTVTTIVSDTPDPSVRNNNVVVTVQVTGGSTTPTGTVNVDAGGNRNCVATLSNGSGSCTLNFNQAGTYRIDATYSGDSAHQASSDFNGEPHQVLDGSPTPSPTRTITPIPTNTLIPTSTLPPTATGTAVPICTGVTHGPLVMSGNSLSMTITNPYSYPLTTGNGTVTWNHDKGHQLGTDKSLQLLNATLNGTTIWNSGPTGDNIFSVPFTTPAIIPANFTATIVFNFQQSYDNFDTTELITFEIITNGCNNLLISSQF